MDSFNEGLSSLKNKAIDFSNKEFDDANGVELIEELFKMLGLMSDRIGKLENELKETNEYVSVLDENIGNIEDELYGFEDEEYEFDINDFFEVSCDKCNENISVEKTLQGTGINVECPNCKNIITIE